ncbi:glycosyltransferase family 4 protein [Hafnia psychrotolerans]|uniref:Glycosyl transferase family 1 n=1 Tax=Hafnia psychrotolerans TaxID=1477018 RepID=A0ABQ1G3I7_9GAMM|nr:glycosyltransferase family 4 protein [Hafnia psychrotolerans]GGA34781.1 glycosyl transferase family 1 [Hafnia psychrotolerans]
MLKVLHFYKTYYPDTFGGIEQVIFQLSEGGEQCGFKSDVLSLSPRGKVDKRSVSKHTVHCESISFSLASTPFSWAVIKRFKELAAQADIIHYHFPFPFMDLVHFISGIKKPTVVSYHSDIVKQKLLLKLYTPLMELFLSKVDRIVAASPNYVETSHILQKFKDKVSVIPYGLDEHSYPKSTESKLNQWRAKLPSKFFLFIGAFRYYKGLHVLLEAAQHSDYPIVIIGSGPAESELKKQTKELGLTNVYFVGALEDEDKIALLELCYAIVFPSHLRSEAFGISLLEGAMFEKPLISCEIGTGTTFINIDKETGIAVPPCDVAALREAMDTLWESPALAKQYGVNARYRYETVFTSHQMIEKYSKLYQSLIIK